MGLEPETLKQICRIGLPSAAQSALYSISNIVIQSSINGFGTTAVAAWSVYGKIDFLFWMTVNSFGLSITTFAGQNFGARQYDRVRKGAKVCLGMTAIATISISVILYPLAGTLFRLFSQDSAVVALGIDMMHFLVPTYITYISIEIFAGTLRGCGDVKIPTLITVFGVCVLRVLWLIWAVPLNRQLWMVEASYPITWTLSSLLFILYYLRSGWAKRCKAAQQAAMAGK